MNAIARIDAFVRAHPLTRAAPHRAWARFVAWQIRSRVQGEVIVPWIETTRLAARRRMASATRNIAAEPPRSVWASGTAKEPLISSSNHGTLTLLIRGGYGWPIS